VINRFGRARNKWPNDPPGYVFLARAFNEIGPAIFAEKWPKKEKPTETQFTLAQTLDAPEKLSVDELDASDILHDQESNDTERMHRAVKDKVVKGCFEGCLVSAVRAKEGGKMKKLEPEMWNAENLDYRFPRCEMSLATPFKKSPFPETHWIFLERESLDRFLATQLYSPNAISTTDHHMSPYLRAMLAVTESLQITPQHQPKKELVIDEIKRVWSGKPLSNKLVDTMATLIREPESQLGRAKKK
jgi:hypothetical protein